MMSGPKRVLTVALLMLPCTVWADFLSDRIGEYSGTTSLLLHPSLAPLEREPAILLLPPPHETIPWGLSMGYAEPMSESPAIFSPSLLDQTKHFSATAVGGFALSDRIGLFGKAGLRYAAHDDLATAPGSGTGYVLRLARRYGVGVNMRANEVLSLHFEWERHAPGGVGAGVDLTRSDWDPWKEKNVFGAGMRLGF